MSSMENSGFKRGEIIGVQTGGQFSLGIIQHFPPYGGAVVRVISPEGRDSADVLNEYQMIHVSEKNILHMISNAEFKLENQIKKLQFVLKSYKALLEHRQKELPFLETVQKIGGYWEETVGKK